MGIYSTLNITRTKATAIVAALLEAKLELVRSGQLSDIELEEYLDEFLKPRLNNAVVVNDHNSNDDEWVPDPV